MMTTIAASECILHKRPGLHELDNKAMNEWDEIDAISGKQTSNHLSSEKCESDQ